MSVLRRCVGSAFALLAVQACSDPTSSLVSDGPVARMNALDVHLTGPNVHLARVDSDFVEESRSFLDGTKNADGSCSFSIIGTSQDPPVSKLVEKDLEVCRFVLARGHYKGPRAQPKGQVDSLRSTAVISSRSAAAGRRIAGALMAGVKEVKFRARFDDKWAPRDAYAIWVQNENTWTYDGGSVHGSWLKVRQIASAGWTWENSAVDTGFEAGPGYRVTMVDHARHPASEGATCIPWSDDTVLKVDKVQVVGLADGSYTTSAAGSTYGTCGFVFDFSSEIVI